MRLSKRGEYGLRAMIALAEPAPKSDVLLRHCFVKDPRGRLRDLGDVALLVREIASGKGTAEAPPAAAPAARRSWLPIASAGALALLAGFAIGARWLAHRGTPTGHAGARPVDMAPLTDLEGPQNAPSLSPDGKMLLYVSREGGDEDIFLLRVGGENPTLAYREDVPAPGTCEQVLAQRGVPFTETPEPQNREPVGCQSSLPAT